jgi:hypothetical protein
VIGHPVIRAWYERHEASPGRPSIDDSRVRDLVERIAPGVVLVDLGGSDHLNLRLGDSNVVLRVNEPFVSRRQIVGGQLLRRASQRPAPRSPSPSSVRLGPSCNAARSGRS